MDLHPPGEAPPIVLPSHESEGRRPAGWIALVAVFLLLMITQMAALLEEPKEQQKSYRIEEAEFEAQMMMREFGAVPISTKQGRLPDLDATVSELAKDRFSSDEAAMLYAAIRHEQGYPITGLDLKRLANSKDKQESAFARVYGNGELSVDDADKIEADLNGSTFVHTMGAIHGHERAGDKSARKRLLPQKKWGWRLGIGIAIVLGGAAGLSLWGVYVIRRMKGDWKPLGHPLSEVSLPQADSIAARMALFLVAFNVIPLLVLLTLRPVLSDEAMTAISLVVILFSLIGLLRLKIYGSSMTLSQTIGDTSKLGQKILWGLGGAVANIPIVVFLGILGTLVFRSLPEPTHPAVEELLKSPTPLAMAMFFFAAVLMAPVIEELSFRGLLFPAIGRTLRSVPKGIFWSSLAFAAIHPQGIALWPALAAIGAMGAMLAVQTRSLIPSIVMHAVHNGALLAIIILAL